MVCRNVTGLPVSRKGQHGEAVKMQDTGRELPQLAVGEWWLTYFPFTPLFGSIMQNTWWKYFPVSREHLKGGLKSFRPDRLPGLQICFHCVFVKTQTENPWMLNNHKSQVITVINNKRTLSGSWSAMAYYEMNYRLCTKPFPCGGEGVLKGKWGRPESVHSPGDCLIKEPLMLLRGESWRGHRRLLSRGL